MTLQNCKTLAAGRGREAIVEPIVEAARSDCWQTSEKVNFWTQNSPAKSRGCKPQKTADPIRRPLARLSPAERGKTPPAVLEAILRAEIGETGVVRNLRDRPPQQLLAGLQRSTGKFATEAREGFPRRIPEFNDEVGF